MRDLLGRPRTLGLTLFLLWAGCGIREPDPASLLARGDELIEAEQYGDAADAYRLAVQADPLNGEARVKLADALWRAQQWAEGAREAIRAADLLPRNPDVQFVAASRELTLGRFPEAVARASSLLRDKPDHVGALIVLGNGTARLGDSFSALAVLRTKLQRPEAFDAALRNVRPITLSSDDAKAEEILRRALALAPDAYESRLALVNFLWASERQDEAATLLQQLADEQSGNALLNHALGEYYLSKGKEAEGERYLKAAAAAGDRQATFALVERHTAAGRDDEALALLDGLASDEPPGSVSVPRAAIECRHRQYDAALQRIDRVLARVPQHGEALAMKATCLLAVVRPAEALQAARGAVTAAPSLAAAHFVLGEALSASEANDEAFAAYSEAVRLDPLHRPASRALARHALDLGRPEVAMVLARDLVLADPVDREAGVLLVRSLILRREHASAEQALKPLVTRFPASPDVLVAQGDVHRARGTSGARASYERALALDPDSLEGLNAVVSLDLSEKRTAIARERVERALVRSPNRPGYLLLLGQVSQTEGNLAAGEAAYRRLIGIDAGHVQAALQLSALLRAQRRDDEARNVLEGLLKRRPGAAEARVALGTLLEDSGRTSDAESHYTKVLTDNPRAGVAAYKLALLQADQGKNLDVALDLAITAVQTLPSDHPGANDAIGWIYVRKKLPDAGVRHLETSVRADPENPTYRYHLGMAYVAMGQPQKGRAELARALASDQPFRFETQARAALDAAPR